jgi:hypothetical protein
MSYPDDNIDYQNTSVHVIYYALISNVAYVTFNIYWISFQFRATAAGVNTRTKFGNNEWNEWR